MYSLPIYVHSGICKLAVTLWLLPQLAYYLFTIESLQQALSCARLLRCRVCGTLVLYLQLGQTANRGATW